MRCNALLSLRNRLPAVAERAEAQVQQENTARHSRNQMQRTGGNRDNGEYLFPPLAPVQLSLSRGRDALNGALAQRAGPGANPRGKARFLASASFVFKNVFSAFVSVQRLCLRDLCDLLVEKSVFAPSLSEVLAASE
jgi:hypothetical protein